MLALLFVTGCSTAIYESGRYADVLKRGSTREQIRARLGEPAVSGRKGTNEIWTNWIYTDGTFDEFVVRGPVYDSIRSSGSSMAVAMTLGFGELLAFPEALLWKLTDRGWKRVTVLYSAESNYGSHSVVDTKKPAAPDDSASGANPD